MGDAVRLRQRMGIVAVVAACLVLLLYVAWGEMVRTGQRFQTERLTAQAQSLQSALSGHVQSGLALEQFAGFTELVAQLQASDPQLRSVGLRTAAGRYLFETQAAAADAFTLEVPVRTRFETVGFLVLALDGDIAQTQVRAYLPVLLGCALVLGLLASAMLIKVEGGDGTHALSRQRTILLLMLLAQTAVVVAVMWQVYSVGARLAAQAQAENLAGRLMTIPAHGLDFNDFSDIAQTLAQERQRSRHVQELSVRVNDGLLFRSVADEQLLSGSALTQINAIRTLQFPSSVKLDVSLSVPTSVVVMSIARNLKNFAFLFVATVLMGLLLLRLFHGFGAANSPLQSDSSALAGSESLKASAILFLTVFCDQLSAAFLSPWVTEAAGRSGYSTQSAAWVFTAYFLSFAGALLPCEKLAASGQARRLVWIGALLVSCGASWLALNPGLIGIVMARIISGVGQAAVFVAVSYLLQAWAAHQGALRANTSIVFQFNAGMICGLALGSLLVVYLHPAGVFWLVGIVGLVVACLAGQLRPVVLPAHERPQVSPVEEPVTGKTAVDGNYNRQGMLRCWGDRAFAAPALLIGIPSKALMTGLVVYGLPLMLSFAGLGREETGQLLLFYAVGVLSLNEWLSRHRPSRSRLQWITSIAMLASALAVAGMGVSIAALQSASDTASLPWGSIGLLLVCVLVLGYSHGAINAPVVTLVGSSPVAQQRGVTAVTTYYRFVERIGHVAGPALVAHLLLWSEQAATALFTLAGGLLALGALTILMNRGAFLSRAGGTVRCVVMLLLPLLALVVSVSAVVLHPQASVAASATQKAADAAGAGPAWLTLSAATKQSWQVSTVGSERYDVMTLTPVFTGHLSGKSVDLLMFKPSPAYDIAIDRLLQVWAEKALEMSVRVLYVRENTDVAHELIRASQLAGRSLLMAVGSDTTAFVHAHYRNASLPLLSVCAKDPVLMGQMSSYETGSGHAMAYTSLNSPVDVQLSHLEQIRPGLQHLAIIVDRRNASAWQTQTVPLEARARQDGISVYRVVVDGSQDVQVQLSGSMQNALAAMQQQDPNGAFSAFWVTGSSSVFSQLPTINRLAGAVPVFSAVPDLVRSGADSADVSIGVSFEENAHLAAIYAERIVSGQVTAGQLPVGVVSPPEIAINFMKTRQSGLRVPFSFFEKASTVHDASGQRVRWRGSLVQAESTGAQ